MLQDVLKAGNGSSSGGGRRTRARGIAAGKKGADPAQDPTAQPQPLEFGLYDTSAGNQTATDLPAEKKPTMEEDGEGEPETLGPVMRDFKANWENWS